MKIYIRDLSPSVNVQRDSIEAKVYIYIYILQHLVCPLSFPSTLVFIYLSLDNVQTSWKQKSSQFHIFSFLVISFSKQLLIKYLLLLQFPFHLNQTLRFSWWTCPWWKTNLVIRSFVNSAELTCSIGELTDLAVHLWQTVGGLRRHVIFTFS